MPPTPNTMKLKPIAAAGIAALMALGGFMVGRGTSAVQAGAGNPAAGSKGAAGSSSSANGTTAGGGADSVGRAKGRSAKASSSRESDKEVRWAKLEAIVRGEDPLERNRALMAYIDQLAPGDFQEAVDNFRNLGITDGRMGEYSLLLSAWAQVDPLSALDYAKENTNGGFARDTILTTWAGKDPEAAVLWAKANFDGEGANPYIPGIIRGLAGVDPIRATELLASMPRSEERGRGLDFMLPHLLQQSPEAARSWIVGLKDDALRDGAMMRAAPQLASSDPAGTAKWLLDNPGDAAKRRMDDVYGIWASADQQAALASLNALPAGETRSDALRGVVRSITTEDPAAGLALMNRVPGDVTDDVVRDFVWHSFGNDPALAANQISRITDQRERDQTYRRALGEWMRRDAPAATTWIQANAVPDNVRNDLLGTSRP